MFRCVFSAAHRPESDLRNLGWKFPHCCRENTPNLHHIYRSLQRQRWRLWIEQFSR